MGAQPISPQIWNKAALTDNRLRRGIPSVSLLARALISPTTKMRMPTMTSSYPTESSTTMTVVLTV